MNGKIVKISSEKTAIVQIESVYTHPVYNKQIKKVKKLMVHDELGAKVGDVVQIQSTRPLSKRKHHKVSQILKGAL